MCKSTKYALYTMYDKMVLYMASLLLTSAGGMMGDEEVTLS